MERVIVEMDLGLGFLESMDTIVGEIVLDEIDLCLGIPESMYIVVGDRQCIHKSQNILDFPLYVYNAISMRILWWIVTFLLRGSRGRTNHVQEK